MQICVVSREDFAVFGDYGATFAGEGADAGAPRGGAGANAARESGESRGKWARAEGKVIENVVGVVQK